MFLAMDFAALLHPEKQIKLRHLWNRTCYLGLKASEGNFIIQILRKPCQDF